MKHASLYDEIKSLPESLQKEVRNFIEFLLEKQKAAKASSLHPKRRAGLAKGLITMRSDFDEPLEDFREYV